MPRLLVFSDLDGTLLDHETYCYAAARPALAALRDRGALVILASSKTAAEMLPLHQELELGDAPLIVENGAACVKPTKVDSDQATYQKLRRLLSGLGMPFQGFGDMTASDVAAVTGLSRAAAERAKARQFSEPGIWQGDELLKTEFLAALAHEGVTAREGGRFLTLSYGATKAVQMHKICQQYAPCFTVALGDAPNDAELITAADVGVVVRNDHSPKMAQFAAQHRILHTREPGPKGWNTAMQKILNEWDQNQKGAAAHG